MILWKTFLFVFLTQLLKSNEIVLEILMSYPRLNKKFCKICWSYCKLVASIYSFIRLLLRLNFERPIFKVLFQLHSNMFFSKYFGSNFFGEISLNDVTSQSMNSLSNATNAYTRAMLIDVSLIDFEVMFIR